MPTLGMTVQADSRHDGPPECRTIGAVSRPENFLYKFPPAHLNVYHGISFTIMAHNKFAFELTAQDGDVTL